MDKKLTILDINKKDYTVKDVETDVTANIISDHYPLWAEIMVN